MPEPDSNWEDVVRQYAPGATILNSSQVPLPQDPLFMKPIRQFTDGEMPRVTYRRVGTDDQWRLFDSSELVKANLSARNSGSLADICVEFHVVPDLIAVRREVEFEAPPGVREFTNYPETKWRLLMGIDWLLSCPVLEAINISVAPFSKEPFDPEEPLHVATGHASGLRVPVAVAAGNDGHKGEDTVQTLARAPWVIPVAALDDNDEVLATSARGSKDTPPPTVADLGSPLENVDLPRVSPGTSFASPRVMKSFAYLRNGLRLAAKEVSDFLNGELDTEWLKPIRLPIYGYVDAGPGDPAFMRPFDFAEQVLSGDDRIGIQRQANIKWIEAVVEAVGDQVARSLVHRSYEAAFFSYTGLATPLAKPDTDRVQYGKFSTDKVKSFLSSLTPQKFLDVFDVTHHLDDDKKKWLASVEETVWTEPTCQTLQYIYWTQDRSLVAAIED